MSLKLGTTNINSVKLGTTSIQRMMLGTTQVYTSTRIPLSIFDGTNDFMSRGSDLTSNADSKVLTFSCFFSAAAGGNQVLFDNLTDRCYGEILASGKMNFRGRDGASNVAWDIYSTTTVDDGNVHNVMFSVDAATGAYHLYIDGVNRADTGASSTANFTVDYTTGNFWVGVYGGSAEKLNGDLGQFYWNNAAYVDLSSPTNRAKFYNSGPVDMGATGALPTGASPRIFLNNVYTSFQTNGGTGGNFTVTGTLADGGLYP